MNFSNITVRVEFADYRGSVKTRDFTNLNYTSTGSIIDEVDHLKKVNNWQKVINITSIEPQG
jgi:hypothetical protein